MRNFFNDKRDTLDGSQVYGEKRKGAQRHGRKRYSKAHKLRMDLSIRVILDLIVPEIALQMVAGNTHFLSLEQISKVIGYCLNTITFRPRYQNWHRWYYGYEVDAQSIFDEIRQIDNGERIPQYICELLGVMRTSADQTLSFTHQYFRDYFAACALVGRILTVLEAKSENSALTAMDEQFSILIYPFQRKLFSSHICSLVGEILGESHNIPFYCKTEGKWKLPETSSSEQTILSRFLECYRVAPEHSLDGEAVIGFENLIAIFRGSRVQNDGRVDFSGMALHHLDLKDVSLSNVLLSRCGGESMATLAADLSGSTHVEEALLHNGRTQPRRCIAAHPTKKRILL